MIYARAYNECRTGQGKYKICNKIGFGTRMADGKQSVVIKDGERLIEKRSAFSVIHFSFCFKRVSLSKIFSICSPMSND